ncbi:response regulator [Paenibacillus sp. CGMCC 1.16610]|uniref:Response regulator n=1 Tax=Paenibacillus anseongense TaxID=2682845 RepID=A0ABW9UKW0_9BACL|nr:MULTISPECIES: response regulator [Paenibacillus]MBA2939698.1 response regulator [Paenibacillus sp. CGMCC 1.16610]MVQ39358.1 response regulator [Paenibacillus anseongense]
MYRLLIADDEALEREGLEMMVSRMLPGQFEFIHAENGRKAIQMADEKRPDFIFMDIKMPGIQGLEAVREIMSRHQEVRIILVTAHDYFAYAKEALSLGVKDYILKPAKRDELIEVLRKQAAELEEEKRRRGEELEIREKLTRLLPLAENELTMMLMMDCIQEFDLRYLVELLNISWEQGYAMVLSFPFGERKDWEHLQSVRKVLHEDLKQYAKLQLACMVSPMIGNRMAVFVPVPSSGAGFTNRVDALVFGERLQAFAEHRFKLSLSIGIGTVGEGMEGLRRSYQEAAAASADSSDVVRIRHYEDICQRDGVPGIALDEERKLLDALQRQHKEEARIRFLDVLERLIAGSGADDRVCRDEVVGLLISLARQISHRSPAEIVSHFAGVAGMASLRQTAAEQLERMLEDMTEEREHRQFRVIERAKSYIGEHYKSDISMEQTAEYVNLSPYYFSKTFKLHTGETFIDYVTRLRIDEAKRLLESEELSFKEICYMAGYNDPNYFSRIFKKTTGVTPTEYRQQLSP